MATPSILIVGGGAGTAGLEGLQAMLGGDAAVAGGLDAGVEPVVLRLELVQVGTGVGQANAE